MQHVKWVGSMGLPQGTSRFLSADDLSRLGVDYKHGDLLFDTYNRFTIEMSNEASDSLVAALPKEFVIVDPNADDESDQSPDDSDNPEDDPKLPQGDGNADDDDSSDDEDPD